MNTNHDPFENELRTLQRRELSDSWRDEILRAAERAPRVARTPRWLVAGWGLAWAATVVMYFTMPSDPVAPQTTSEIHTAPPLLWEQRAAAIAALLAAN
jgi:hypothetical protein